MNEAFSDDRSGQLILNELKELRAEVHALGHRIERLESIVSELHEPIDENDLVVLAAAVAAYLGKRTPIRQVRLIGSKSWATQGRVTLQASHHLEVMHERTPR
ncbi:MAG: hypothetical protein AMXMBFR33_32390 [Candidatus Xenobia bacterium]